MKMRERAGEKEMWMLCKIFSPSLLKSLSFENFSSVALFLSLSLAFVDSIDLGREREREKESARGARFRMFFIFFIFLKLERCNTNLFTPIFLFVRTYNFYDRR